MSSREPLAQPPKTRRREQTSIPTLSTRHVRVLLHAAVREITWTLPAVAREVRQWRALASAIPDESIRRAALSALAHKRGHTDGAALFCILSPSRNTGLVRLLVAYELMWDFLDSVNESGADRGQANGRRLHVALVDAVTATSTHTDYYHYHPARNDGGYLTALVSVSRSALGGLPSCESVRDALVQEAWRAQVLGINHELDPVHRDRDLRRWADTNWPSQNDVHWYELTGAASASLTVHALFAHAATQSATPGEIEAILRAYSPWISATTTMLDSYVDQVEDVASGDHSYVAHYSSSAAAVKRIVSLIERSILEASYLRDGERHELIVACMIAMYLSKESARAIATRRDTQKFLSAGGTLARVLLPILRLWRLAYGQRST